MSDTKFTPGPWTFDTSEEWPMSIGSQSDDVLFGCGCCGSPNLSRDNAHLIAAAPDLYAALEEQSKYHWGEYKYHAEMCASMQASEHLWRAEEIDAALAKARGDHSSSD